MKRFEKKLEYWAGVYGTDSVAEILAEIRRERIEGWRRIVKIVMREYGFELPIGTPYEDVVELCREALKPTRFSRAVKVCDEAGMDIYPLVREHERVCQDRLGYIPYNAALEIVNGC